MFGDVGSRGVLLLLSLNLRICCLLLAFPLIGGWDQTLLLIGHHGGWLFLICRRLPLIPCWLWLLLSGKCWCEWLVRLVFPHCLLNPYASLLFPYFFHFFVHTMIVLVKDVLVSVLSEQLVPYWAGKVENVLVGAWNSRKTLIKYSMKLGTYCACCQLSTRGTVSFGDANIRDTLGVACQRGNYFPSAIDLSTTYAGLPKTCRGNVVVGSECE